MAGYIVKFSDSFKTPISINTGSINYSTSLGLVGRNAPGFGTVIAENFLHLLENFSSPIPPINPIEGQLWYDTSDTNNKKLKINDGAATKIWYPVNGIHQSFEPPTNVKNGDIWVDLTSQQLKIYSNSYWKIVGPEFSDTLQNGSITEIVLGTDGDEHYITKNYLNGEIISILAKENFKPVVVIDGFDNLVSGINLNTNKYDTTVPILSGRSYETLNLRVTNLIPSGETVPANYFFRKDIQDSLTERLMIKNNLGLAIGQTSTFYLQKSEKDALILNDQDRAKILFRITKDNIRNLILTINGDSKSVGVGGLFNTTATLDVNGSFNVSSTSTIGGNLMVGGITTFTGVVNVLNTITLSNNLLLGGPLIIGKENDLQNKALLPYTNLYYDIGSTDYRFGKLYTYEIALNRISSTSTIYINGPTTFASSATIGDTLTVNGITTVKNSILPNSAATYDIGSPTKSFNKIYVDDIGGATTSIIKTGMIMAWTTSTIPSGWIICDGTTYNTSTYTSLFETIGTNYGDGGVDTFNVPDIPVISPITGPNISYIIKI